MSDDYDEGYELDENLSKVAALTSIEGFLKDDDVIDTLTYVVRLISKPDIPAKVATPLITKLQALSFKFKMQAKYYAFIGKGEDDSSHKKQYYFSLAEETEKLVQALKYTTRNY